MLWGTHSPTVLGTHWRKTSWSCNLQPSAIPNAREPRLSLLAAGLLPVPNPACQLWTPAELHNPQGEQGSPSSIFLPPGLPLPLFLPSASLDDLPCLITTGTESSRLCLRPRRTGTELHCSVLSLIFIADVGFVCVVDILVKNCYS